MMLRLDERALRARLAPLLDELCFRAGIANLTGEPFLLAFFLMSVSQGEGLGEAAVGMIREEELARRLHDLRRQQAEERGHKEGTRQAALELFPEYFDAGRYRFEEKLDGRDYYVTVLDTNRARLRERGRYSRLNQYLTTTFGYEVMVLLLYAAVARSVERSGLATAVRERVATVLDGILREEETHLGVIDQHNALLATERAGLSRQAVSLLRDLERLEEDDYAYAAELSVREVVARTGRYADAARSRREIEAARAEA